MAIYHSWSSVSGNATSPTLAYDKNYGDTTTYATIGSSGTLARNHVFQCSTSLTGMSACTLKLRYRYWVGMGGSYYGYITGQYSWGGSTWYPLYLDAGDPGSRGEATEASFPLSNFTSTTNLNTLRLRFTSAPGASFDEEFEVNVAEPSAQEILDIAVDVSTGPTYTVNAISGSTSLQAGHSAQYSTTVTNDSTNNCTWTIVSGGGSLSGAVNDSSSTRVTWTAPNTSGGSAVLKCTSNIDTSKTAQVTITVPAVGVSMYNGYWGTAWPVAAGSTVTHSAAISGHSNVNGSWSVSGGSLANQSTDATKNYIQWTYPTVPGKYTITFTHGIDTAKSVTVTTYVDYLLPSNTSESDPSGVASLSNPSYIWDENAGTACGFYVSPGDGQGYWSASMEVFGFPSMGSCYTITLSFDGTVGGMGLGVHVQWSHDGGSTWGLVTNLDDAFNGNFTQDLTTPQGSFNASSLRFRFTGQSWAEYEWDGSQWVWMSGGGTAFTLIGLYVKVKTRGYGAVTDYVAPTTTNPRQVFPGNKWNLSTGTISPPTTTTPAIMSYDYEATPTTSGPRILKYFVGAV